MAASSTSAKSENRKISTETKNTAVPISEQSEIFLLNKNVITAAAVVIAAPSGNVIHAMPKEDATPFPPRNPVINGADFE